MRREYWIPVFVIAALIVIPALACASPPPGSAPACVPRGPSSDLLMPWFRTAPCSPTRPLPGNVAALASGCGAAAPVQWTGCPIQWSGWSIQWRFGHYHARA